MGKTFVEDERPCDSCVNVTRYGCVSWNCEYINRDEAIKAWREKHEMADRKTEPTISKMEQVDEPQTQLTAKCLECNNSKACKENHWEGCRYEPLGYEVTAVVGTIKDEPQTDCAWR